MCNNTAAGFGGGSSPLLFVVDTPLLPVLILAQSNTPPLLCSCCVLMEEGTTSLFASSSFGSTISFLLCSTSVSPPPPLLPIFSLIVTPLYFLTTFYELELSLCSLSYNIIAFTLSRYLLLLSQNKLLRRCAKRKYVSDVSTSMLGKILKAKSCQQQPSSDIKGFGKVSSLTNNNTLILNFTSSLEVPTVSHSINHNNRNVFQEHMQSHHVLPLPLRSDPHIEQSIGDSFPFLRDYNLSLHTSNDTMGRFLPPI